MIYGERIQWDCVLGTAAYDANFVNHCDRQVWIKQASGVAPAQTRAAVAATTAAYPGADVLTKAE